jgi:hypothetical protein
MRRIGLWWLITTITANVAIVSIAEGQEVAFALSPLLPNYLFIAYGLTSLPIMFLAVPFFVG